MIEFVPPGVNPKAFGGVTVVPEIAASGPRVDGGGGGPPGALLSPISGPGPVALSVVVGITTPCVKAVVNGEEIGTVVVAAAGSVPAGVIIAVSLGSWVSRDCVPGVAVC